MFRLFLIFGRIALFILILSGITIFAMRSYFLYQSEIGIKAALQAPESQKYAQGSPDFAMVFFYDYQSQNSLEFYKALKEALQHETNFVLMDLPVNSTPGSEKINIFVTAAREYDQEKGLELHNALLSSRSPINFETARQIAKEIGFDIAEIEKRTDDKSIASFIHKNGGLVKQIGFYEVPAMILGNKGYLPTPDAPPSINQLKLMMIDARQHQMQENDK